MFLSAEPTKRETNGDGGHWYYPDGRPLHTVPKKDGSGERNTHKGDARELGLFPSVTAITKVIANEGLERWKQGEIVKACIKSPIVAGEDEKEYTSGIYKLAQKEMIDARVFGSLYHNAIDELNKTGFLDEKYDEIKPYMKYYIDWTRDHRVSFVDTEFVCVNEKLGYAGQVDGLAYVDGKLTLLDYKTQDVKEDKNGKPQPRFFDSFVQQLAAYKNASWPTKPARIQQVMSVVLCRQAPCYPHVRVWSASELSKAWKTFKACCQLWQLNNNFDPAANVRLLNETGGTEKQTA